MIKIYTYAHKRPDFIAIQFDSISKYLKDDYEYVVFNNAIDDENLSSQIEKECQKINIKCIKVQLQEDINNQNFIDGSEIQFINNNGNYKYANPNVACSYPLIWSFKNIISKDDNENIIVIIDSDMFFSRDISIKDLMTGYDIAFIPQYRNNDVHYMWNGFVIIDGSKNNLNEINWFCGRVNGQPVDVGGQTHFYLKNNPQLKIMYLEFWNLNEFNNDEYRSHLNGNMCVLFSLKDNEVVDFTPIDSRFTDNNKLFDYEIDKDSFDEYIKYYTDNIKYIKNSVESFNFPKPEHIDFIKCYNKKIEDFFIFHYKSGSNYLNFQDNNYNKLKTNALKKLIESL
jgi:hypothetical protein